MNEIITFPDRRIEARVRRAIGKSTGDILAEDVTMITRLDLSYLGGNQIVDPSGLAALRCTRIYGLPRIGR